MDIRHHQNAESAPRIGSKIPERRKYQALTALGRFGTSDTCLELRG
jgi:hypothetical protein